MPEDKPFLESELERALVQQIEKFLLELGRGFMFVGTQQRLTINNTRYILYMPNKDQLIAQVEAVLDKWNNHQPEVFE